jgi:hypothetical protein
MGMTTGWFDNYSRHSSHEQKPENEIKNPHQSKLASLSSRCWESLTQLFTRNTEPYIWQKRDRHGNLFWQLYDPSTNRSATFSSEDEVRIWLEERYYHSP